MSSEALNLYGFKDTVLKWPNGLWVKWFMKC